MASGRKESKKAKYGREVEEIKRLHDLNRILKAGDLENALLSSASSDSEIMNETVVDSLLGQAEREAQAGSRGLEVIAKLTTTSSGGKRMIREKKLRAGRRPRPVTKAKIRKMKRRKR